MTSPTLRPVDAVSSRSPWRNSSCQPAASLATLAVSAPVVSQADVASSPTTTSWSSVVVSAKRGPRSTPPAWWVIVTPTTPSAGEKRRTVTRAVFRVSPRVTRGRVGAWATRLRPPVSTDSTPRGCSTVKPLRVNQYPSVNFMAG